MILVAVVGIAFAQVLQVFGKWTSGGKGFAPLARNHLVNRLNFAQDWQAHQAAKADTERHRMRAEYHHSLSLKYQYAASHPWLSVPPDPPALEVSGSSLALSRLQCLVSVRQTMDICEEPWHSRRRGVLR